MGDSACRPLQVRRLDGSRLTIPRACRDAYAGEATLAADLAGCVVLTPPGIWERVLADLQKLSARNRHALELFRFHSVSAVTVAVDSRGRLVIPDIHLHWAGLERGGSVLVLAVGDAAQIWEPRRLAQRLDLAKEELRALDAHLLREQLPLVVDTRDWDRHGRPHALRRKP
ncbi:MAG: hypothetical protein HPY44_00870 [Armatimonadetes bacterium]|nr:hypothetical protein [Armatimonadota bacterium]